MGLLIVFRADASVDIGTGHVMRCLALAHALRDKGWRISFVCRVVAGNLCALIEGQGFDVSRLPNVVSSQGRRASEGWQVDAEQTQAALERMALKADWLIVDHYGLDARWERAMRPWAVRIMAIDDLANRTHDCDLLLDQNLYDGMHSRYDALVSAQCQKLIGPGYALLRPEFSRFREGVRARNDIVQRILVFFGGSDPTNETVKALQALQQIERDDIEVDVVVGASNPRCDEIEKLCRVMPGTSYYCQTASMAELMRRADLALGAGGTTSWERCCLGLPALVIAVADNQVESMLALSKHGAIYAMGTAIEVSAARIASALRQVLSDRELLYRMSGIGMQLVDGQGTARVFLALQGATNE